MRESCSFPPVSDPFLTALIAATYVRRTASETFQTLACATSHCSCAPTVSPSDTSSPTASDTSGTTGIGYVEHDGTGYVEHDDVAASQAAMARTEVYACRPRQPSLAGVDGRPPDEGFQLLTEVFHREEEK